MASRRIFFNRKELLLALASAWLCGSGPGAQLRDLLSGPREFEQTDIKSDIHVAYIDTVYI